MSRAIPKTAFVMIGGPFKNQKVWLQNDGAGTFEFSIHDMVGRYDHKGKWIQTSITLPHQFEFRENVNGLSTGLVK